MLTAFCLTCTECTCITVTEALSNSGLNCSQFLSDTCTTLLTHVLTTTDIALQGVKTTVVYCAFKYERCPTTDRVHMHFMICFSKQLRYTCLRELPFFLKHKNPAWKEGDDGDGISLNIMPITNTDASLQRVKEYLEKHETALYGPVTFGSVPYQGKRTDWHNVADQYVANGFSDRATVMENRYGYGMFHRQLHAMRDAMNQNDPFKLEEIICIVGSGGSGKSHWVQTNFNVDSIYSGMERKNKNTYHPGYRNHEVFYVTEMNGSMYPLNGSGGFKDIFDIGRKTQATLSNSRADSSVPFGSRVVVFTSNQLPWEWYSGCDIAYPDHYSGHEIFRRFTRVLVFGGSYGLGNSWHVDLSSASGLQDFYNLNKLCRQHGYTGDSAIIKLNAAFRNVPGVILHHAQPHDDLVVEEDLTEEPPAAGPSTSANDSIISHPTPVSKKHKPNEQTEWNLVTRVSGRPVTLFKLD